MTYVAARAHGCSGCGGGGASSCDDQPIVGPRYVSRELEFVAVRTRVVDARIAGQLIALRAVNVLLCRRRANEDQRSDHAESHVA